MVGSSNAVNLTDGLDGLAIGLMIIASGAMTTLPTSRATPPREYLDLAHLPNSQELTIFCASMTGASLGFLWYNCHPAQVFMGDVGSLALGGGWELSRCSSSKKFCWFLLAACMSLRRSR